MRPASLDELRILIVVDNELWSGRAGAHGAPLRERARVYGRAGQSPRLTAARAEKQVSQLTYRFSSI